MSEYKYQDKINKHTLRNEEQREAFQATLDNDNEQRAKDDPEFSKKYEALKKALNILTEADIETKMFVRLCDGGFHEFSNRSSMCKPVYENGKLTLESEIANIRHIHEMVYTALKHFNIWHFKATKDLEAFGRGLTYMYATYNNYKYFGEELPAVTRVLEEHNKNNNG